MDVRKLGVSDVKSAKVRDFEFQYSARGMSQWRFETLLTKEPETIAWIDSFSPGEVLWDIGANIGIYSLYAAAAKGTSVFAFEPNFANYFQLCVNVMLNEQQDKVTPLCLALSSSKSVSTINLSSLDIGASGASFGTDLDPHGFRRNFAFRQGMVGYDIDNFIADFGLTPPTHFKIDVDGLEWEIIQGGQRTFALPAVKSLSVEMDDNDKSYVAKVSDLLQAAGLSFVHKKNSPEFNRKFNIVGFDTTMNFLFARNSVEH